MRVSTRLYLTAVPSVTGILIVAALAYWGQYAYVVPQLVVIVSAVAVIVSLFLSWRNARYVAHRIERLAGDRKSLPAKPFVGSVLLSSGEDELDTIEGVVDNLSDAVVRAETVRSESENAAFKRVRDYATMLSSVADESAARLDEVRLPLHILLENHFGDLNENQEEMLAAARSAAELVDADLVALREIAELDLGRQELRRDRLFPADMIRSLMPTLQAMADKKHARLALNMEPVVPAIRGDQPRLQESLVAVIGAAIRASPESAEMELSLTRDDKGARLDVHGAGVPEPRLNLARAERTLQASGGAVKYRNGTVTIHLPLYM